MSAPDSVQPRRRWHVASGEGAALAASAATYFFLLCGYYMLRSLREAMAIEAGRENIPFLFWVTFVAMLFILPAYWWVVARVPRRGLLAAIYLPVIALFALLMTFVSEEVPPLVAGVYFVAVTALNLFIVSVFWSFMVDLWRPGAAQRLFGLIAAGGSAGALAGPAFNAGFVEGLGATAVTYIACVLLGCAVVTGFVAQKLRARIDESTAQEATVAVGGRAIDDLSRLARSPYLLGIAGLVVAGQIIGALMYNEQAKYVELAWEQLEQRAALFARLDLATNVLALLMQSLVVGWLTARGGVRATLATVWGLGAVSFAILALFPGGVMLLATQVIRRSGDYGLFKPAREMLFTVLAPASKFKSKSLIDTLLQRGADSLGNGVYLLVAGAPLSAIAGTCAAACLLLLAGARWLGTAFADQESRASPSR